MARSKSTAKVLFSQLSIERYVTVHLKSGKTVSGSLQAMDDSGIILNTTPKNLIHPGRKFIPESSYEYVDAHEST